MPTGLALARNNKTSARLTGELVAAEIQLLQRAELRQLEGYFT